MENKENPNYSTGYVFFYRMKSDPDGALIAVPEAYEKRAKNLADITRKSVKCYARFLKQKKQD